MWLPFEYPALGTRPATQTCALTGNWTCDSPVRRPALNPLSDTSQGSNVYIFKKPLTEWIWGRKNNHTVLLNSTNAPNSKTCQHWKTVLHWGFPRGTMSLPRKHSVGTNSLLSSVQTFTTLVTLLLQKSLNIKEFSVPIGGAMIDDVNWIHMRTEFHFIVKNLNKLLYRQVTRFQLRPHRFLIQLSQMHLSTCTGSQSCCSRRKPSYIHRPYFLDPTPRC